MEPATTTTAARLLLLVRKDWKLSIPYVCSRFFKGSVGGPETESIRDNLEPRNADAVVWKQF